MRLATFNVQNLRLRTRNGQPALDGAVDRDTPDVAQSVRLDIADRQRTAQVIHQADADIVALQEVFDTAALDFFHDRFLVPAGAKAYPHRVCLPGNDGSGLNVAALSRIKPDRVTSHARMTGADLGLTGLPAPLLDGPLFRRDCLRLDFPGLALFICHFKAPYPDPESAWSVRNAEARSVRTIIERAFPDPAQARWIILGDFNEPARSGQDAPSAIAPLQDGFAVDLSEPLATGGGWTYETPDTHVRSCPDRILVSPRLAAEYPDVRPRVISTVADPLARPHASDHALLYADFPGLLNA